MESLITEYNREKILYQCRAEFLQDFDIFDVYKDLENVLPFSDLKAIQRCSTKEEKLDKLFFLLVIRGQTAFDNFIFELKKFYPWMAVEVEQRLTNELANNAHIDSDYNLDAFPVTITKLLKELPKFVDFNIHRCELLWELRQRILALGRHHQYLVVHGSLSQGKRWIVMDAICSYQIMRRTGGIVFWINCSKCKIPECILQQLETLFIKSRPSHDTAVTPSHYKDINNKILNYTETLRQIFHKGPLSDCLLVLIDVQSYETVRAFDLNCRTLITTRDKKLLDTFPDATLKVEIDSGFTDFECKELFSKVLQKPISALPDEVADIHRMCKHNPFVISVIAINLKSNQGNLDRWLHWKSLLQKNESTSHESLRKPIEESLKDLRKRNPNLIKRLNSLVIFTDNVNIPIKVLQIYWNLPIHEVEKIVETLSALYLLQTITDDNHKMYCSLHYLYYSYLANNISSNEKQKMHNDLVDGYRITEAFRNRSEPNIADLPDDKYFHYYIGYHLKECGAPARNLFPLLYYDFGFLEQKLRYSGLSNTLGDFKLYGNEIKDTTYQRISIDDLTDFLAYSEELLLASKDTCLLQHALSEEHTIGEEAFSQAQKFQNRIWFADIDHSVKYRQVIKLPDHIQPKYINFIDPNTSLIAFSDHSIHLIDMSYEYTVQPSIYTGHTSAICDIQRFHEYHFVSLDVSGTIIVWSLKGTEVTRRRTSRQEETKIGARQSIPSPRSYNEPSQDYLQTIEHTQNRITSILILNGDGDEPQLLAATVDGEVLMYHWQLDRKKFEIRRSHSIKTRITNIMKMIVIQNTLMTINDGGMTNFHNLIDHALLSRPSLGFPNESPISVYHLPNGNSPENPKRNVSEQQTIAAVFPSGIYQLKISRTRQVAGNSIERNGRQVIERLSEYNLSGEQNSITCCSVTDDGDYLMLGTKKGIIVLDPKTNREILRSSISDKLTSIDVCTATHSACKYMLISATRKGQSVVYVHGIHFKNNLMHWSTNKIGSPMNGRDTMVAWFNGENSFDVCETNDGQFILVAADFKDLVHTKKSADKFNKTVSLDQFSFESRVTNISIGQKRKFVGFRNGNVYEIATEQTLQMSLGDAVEYLRYFEELDVLIGSTRTTYRIITPRKMIARESQLIQNTFVYRQGLIVMLKIDGSFEFLDMLSNQLIQCNNEQTEQVICSSFVNGKIAVGTNEQLVFIYEINMESNRPSINWLNTINYSAGSVLKSIALTESDNLLLALGYKSGTIELFTICTNAAPNLLNKLQSHESDVNALHFSTWHTASTKLTVPIILVSLSSEICFWDITYALNNPMERTQPHRHSKRFDRPNKETNSQNILPFSSGNRNIETNGNTHQLTIDKRMNELSVSTQRHSIERNGNRHDGNPWIGKCGSTQKPQLLSCIKFVGSSAEKIFIDTKFTTFITIDNEGEVYYLRALDFFNRKQQSL